MVGKIFFSLKSFFLKLCTLLGFLIIATVLIFFLISRFKSIPSLPDKTVLTLSLAGNFTEGFSTHPLHFFLEEGGARSFYKLLTTLKKAEGDPKILGLYVNTGTPSLGLAQIQELREAFLSLRKAGKFVYFYTPTFGEMTSASSFYYLATAADIIGIQALGSVGLTGLGAEVPFLKKFMDTVGVTGDFVRHGKYKSYTETFTEEKMSAAFRESLDSILTSFSQQIVCGLSDARRISLEKIQELVKKGPLLGKEAQKEGLIDRIVYEAAFEKEILERAGEKTELVPLAAYQKNISALEKNLRTPEIALIFAEGTIVSDREKDLDHNFALLSPEKIGDASTLKLFEEITKNPTIKAIVYRIDSGGGHAIASDAIREGLKNLRTAGKKVIISMGNTAASGGYLIALGGDEIVADAGTITGSIGAFSGKFVLAPFFEKWGIHWDHVETAPNARFSSINIPFPEEARLKLQSWVDEIYTFFVERTAEVRHLSISDVHALAEGHVWTGEQAQKYKLIDHLGGIFKAIERARILAALPENPVIVIYPQPKSFFEFLKFSLFEEGGANLLTLFKAALQKTFFASYMPLSGAQLYQAPLLIQ